MRFAVCLLFLALMGCSDTPMIPAAETEDVRAPVAGYSVLITRVRMDDRTDCYILDGAAISCLRSE